jgi:hypothetical protein
MSQGSNTLKVQCLMAGMLALGAQAMAPTHVFALQFSSRGNTIILSGSIKPGDQYEFRDFLAAHPGVKYVELNSSGGSIESAGEIGRQIRAHNLSTIVDASYARCGSACTALFASGVQRYYAGAAGIKDRVGTAKTGRGLCYHEGNNFLANGRRGQSGSATAEMIKWFYEFGSGQASSIITKADWRHLYYISAETALSLGLATSTRRP